jgi:single-strand DNA-binding protein
VNKAILIGSLGRDPEVRTMQNGNRVVSFSLATSEYWRDKATGERKDNTTWHNVVVFNENVGKIAESYLKKGSKAYVEGQIQTREYTDKDGAQRKVTEIVIPMFGGHIELLDRRKEEAPEAVDDYLRATGGQGTRLSEQLNDDIPFNMEWR